MKAKDGFKLMNISDDFILIPLGDNMNSFNGTVILNEVSATIWEFLSTQRTYDDVVNEILKEYDTDKKTAEHDVIEAINEMISIGIVED